MGHLISIFHGISDRLYFKSRRSVLSKKCINKTFKEEICQCTAWTSHFDQLSRLVGFIIVCLRFIIPQLYDSIRELSLMIPDIYKSIMSIFEHYRENSTDMFPGQIADMIETKTLPKLFELTNNLLTNIVPMLYEASMSFAKGLFNLFIAFIVSIYMTIDKFILKNAGNCTNDRSKIRNHICDADNNTDQYSIRKF